MRLNKTAFKELRWWASLSVAESTCHLVAPARVVVLYTDASPLRWGAHCAGIDVSGEFPPGLQAAHIGVKELFAIW